MERKPRLRGGKVMGASSYILCDEAQVYIYFKSRCTRLKISFLCTTLSLQSRQLIATLLWSSHSDNLNFSVKAHIFPRYFNVRETKRSNLTPEFIACVAFTLGKMTTKTSGKRLICSFFSYTHYYCISNKRLSL